jgi:hypothetical protein
VPDKLTVADFITAFHGALDRTTAGMAQADIDHAQELADDEAPRLSRDTAMTSLREQMMGLRGTFTTVYGAGILGAYGLGGDTPDDAELLLQRATHTAQLLKSRPITEKPRQLGIIIDAAALATALETTAQQLRTALADVRREEREAQLTQARRDEAIARWNQHYQGVADTITGLYELAGRAELADRVRPTARRRAGMTEDADVPAEPATPATPAAPATPATPAVPATPATPAAPTS